MGLNYFKSMGKWSLPCPVLLGDINLVPTPKAERASSFFGGGAGGAANIFNKQYWTADNRRYSSSRFDSRRTADRHKKVEC
jgi:hypothetical protein